jgi:hypothetical protein
MLFLRRRSSSLLLWLIIFTVSLTTLNLPVCSAQRAILIRSNVWKSVLRRKLPQRQLRPVKVRLVIKIIRIIKGSVEMHHLHQIPRGAIIRSNTHPSRQPFWSSMSVPRGNCWWCMSTLLMVWFLRDDKSWNRHQPQGVNHSSSNNRLRQQRLRKRLAIKGTWPLTIMRGSRPVRIPPSIDDSVLPNNEATTLLTNWILFLCWFHVDGAGCIERLAESVGV